MCGPATAQVAILQIQVVEGEGAVHAPGSRSARPLTVAVTDETGRPVAGAAVSFHLPGEGATGTFPNGLRTEVATTDEGGRASVHGLQVNRVGGRFQIRIVASKEQARAGIVSFQYVAETAAAVRRPAAADSSTAATPPRAASQGGHKKWLIVAAVVAGGAAAGALGATRSTASTPAPVPPAPPSIGAPTIVVVKP